MASRICLLEKSGRIVIQDELSSNFFLLGSNGEDLESGLKLEAKAVGSLTTGKQINKSSFERYVTKREWDLKMFLVVANLDYIQALHLVITFHQNITS